MRKIDYFVLICGIILAILWSKFQPFRIESWADSVYIILIIPVIIVFWEILKKVSSKMKEK